MQLIGPDLYHMLRENYPVFYFESQQIHIENSKVIIKYHFKAGPKVEFKPMLEWNIPPEASLDRDFIEQLSFYIGMVEMVSYWKATCSPEIVIKPFALDEWQKKWWRKLFFHGLGEFFQTNGLAPSEEDFVDFKIESESQLTSIDFPVNENKVVVPVGGGKDSAVTLDLLKNEFQLVPFAVNPRGAIIETVKASGISLSSMFIIKRTIDKNLLKLNSEGFLNGHTPFSALIAYLSMMAAGVSKAKFIALSNESSANEPTDPKTGVNHQYSKTISFERDFRELVSKYLTENIKYFSFLRPLSEFHIAKLFSGLHSYHNVFKSCNVGSKNDEWCGKCPKCLFTYIMLSPFIPSENLIKIFGHNLLNDEALMKYFNELTGLSAIKPFECVGTINEVNKALQMTVKQGSGLPLLLKYFTENIDKLFLLSEDDLYQLNEEHFLPDRFMKILKQAVHV